MDYSKILLPAFDFVLKWANERNVAERFIRLEAERQLKEAVADICRPKVLSSTEFILGLPILIRINLPVGLERSEYDAIVRDAAHKAFKVLPQDVIARIKYGYTLRNHHVKLATHSKSVKYAMRGVRWL